MTGSSHQSTRCVRTLLLALLLAASIAAPASGQTASRTERGFWLGVSPLTGAFQVEFAYDRPATSERIEETAWLNAWALELGWRFSSRFAVGLATVQSREYEYGEEYEYEQWLLRLDWSPARSWWWLSVATGVGQAQAPTVEDPVGTPFVPDGGGFVLGLGGGADYRVTGWLTLRGRVEYVLARKVIPSDVSDEIDVTGWSLGTYVVWTP